MAEVTRPITAIVDSNIVVSLYTNHDVATAAPDKRPWRLRQAGDALRLAIYLHEQKALTHGVLPEPIAKIEELVPPDRATLETAYTHLFTMFVKPRLLGGWDDGGINDPTMRANRADRELVRLAAEHKCPLITFERHTSEGIKKKKQKSIRDLADAAGVPRFAPGDFCKVSQASVDAFLKRFSQLAPSHLVGSKDYNSAQKCLAMMREHFEAVFAAQ